MGLFWSCPKCVNFGCGAEPPTWKCWECGFEGPIEQFVSLESNLSDLKERLTWMVQRVDSIQRMLKKPFYFNSGTIEIDGLGIDMTIAVTKDGEVLEDYDRKGKTEKVFNPIPLRMLTDEEI